MRHVLIPAFAALSFLSVGVAAAQPPSAEQQSAIRTNCRSDYTSYCSSVAAGGPAALQCLQENAAKLSPACGKAVGAVMSAPAPAATPAPASTPAPTPAVHPAGARPMSRREEIRVLRADCRADTRRFCRSVPVGGERVIHCLAGHRDVLSPGCRGALAPYR
jgi:hypothetical protein